MSALFVTSLTLLGLFCAALYLYGMGYYDRIVVERKRRGRKGWIR